MPVDEFAVALAAATTWFLYRPRERATGMWLRSFAFRGLSRQLYVVDELRQVCRRTAKQPRPGHLDKVGGGILRVCDQLFASRTRLLDEDQRANDPPPERSKHRGRASSKRRDPCDCDLQEAVQGGRELSLSSELRTKEEVRQGPMDVRKGPQV